jgi:hypothetical protein
MQIGRGLSQWNRLLLLTWHGRLNNRLLIIESVFYGVLNNKNPTLYNVGYHSLCVIECVSGGKNLFLWKQDGTCYIILADIIGIAVSCSDGVNFVHCNEVFGRDAFGTISFGKYWEVCGQNFGNIQSLLQA